MDNKTRSYIIYFGLTIICFLLAGIAQKRNKKIYVFIIALLLGLVMGLRKRTVGIDSNSYYYFFESIDSISSAINRSDPGFYLLGYFIKVIFGSVYSPFVFYGLLTNFLVVYRLWSLKDITSFKYSILRYITIFYFFAFNCMRQFTAISIIFYSTSFLEEGRYGKFLFIVLITSFIHISSLISAVFVLLEAFKWGELSTRQKNWVSVSILLIPLYVFLTMFVSSGRYERYFSDVEFVSYNSMIIKLLIFIAVYIILRSQGLFRQNNNKSLIYMYYYLIGLLILFLGQFFSHSERIGYYFYVYATVYTGIIANNKKYRYLFRLIILFIVIRAFYTNCLTNSMGQMPYLFNWE